MFIAECIYGIKRNDPSATLLEVSVSTLDKFGASIGRLVHDGQIYRLLSAVFVHLTFIHYLGNIFGIFILVSRI